jgi:F-type H+-transporting ATPase subunit epsilon
MAEKEFFVDIVSPSKKIFSGNAISFTAPGLNGGFQVLLNHTEFLTPISVGEIELVIDPDTIHHYATSGGFVEVHNNKIIVLAETIERSDDIDTKRAQESLDRAEKRVHDHSKEVDMLRAWMALSKAKNRLKIADRYQHSAK